jgi:hypothetical protein
MRSAPCPALSRTAAPQSGRQTLENAIRLVEGHPDWRARVVYGDTGAAWLGLDCRTALRCNGPRTADGAQLAAPSGPSPSRRARPPPLCAAPQTACSCCCRGAAARTRSASGEGAAAGAGAHFSGALPPRSPFVRGLLPQPLTLFPLHHPTRPRTPRPSPRQQRDRGGGDGGQPAAGDAAGGQDLPPLHPAGALFGGGNTKTGWMGLGHGHSFSAGSEAPHLRVPEPAPSCADPPPLSTCASPPHPARPQTKKRYVGFLWESPTQAAPVFDAKGIETVGGGVRAGGRGGSRGPRSVPDCLVVCCASAAAQACKRRHSSPCPPGAPNTLCAILPGAPRRLPRGVQDARGLPARAVQHRRPVAGALLLRAAVDQDPRKPRVGAGGRGGGGAAGGAAPWALANRVPAGLIRSPRGTQAPSHPPCPTHTRPTLPHPTAPQPHPPSKGLHLLQGGAAGHILVQRRDAAAGGRRRVARDGAGPARRAEVGRFGRAGGHRACSGRGRGGWRPFEFQPPGGVAFNPVSDSDLIAAPGTASRGRTRRAQTDLPPPPHTPLSRHGERVPYVIVYGEPGARLVDLAVDPHALMASEGRLRINAVYYITRQVWALKWGD